MTKENKDLKIEFWTSVRGLSKIEELVPRRMTQFIPDWWKSSEYKEGSVRTCPSFPDIFSSSYVVPMWCDTKIERKNNNIIWKTPSNTFSWGYHLPEQFMQYAPSHIQKKVCAVLKASCPWKLKTPSGYSVYEMNPFWHFNQNFEVIPGIMHTDYMHAINQQIFIYLEDGQSFTIERGAPFAVYFPFERKTLSLEVREQNDKDKLKEAKASLIHEGKFIGGYTEYFKYLKKKGLK